MRRVNPGKRGDAARCRRPADEQTVGLSGCILRRRRNPPMLSSRRGHGRAGHACPYQGESVHRVAERLRRSLERSRRASGSIRLPRHPRHCVKVSVAPSVGPGADRQHVLWYVALRQSAAVHPSRAAVIQFALDHRPSRQSGEYRLPVSTLSGACYEPNSRASHSPDQLCRSRKRVRSLVAFRRALSAARYPGAEHAYRA